MGPFFVLLFLFFADSLSLMRGPVRALFMRFWWWALLALVTIHIRMKNRFGQAFTVATLPSPRLSRCRTPAFALVRYQCVEIFDDLDAVSVRFMCSTWYDVTVAKQPRRKTQLRLRTTS